MEETPKPIRRRWFQFSLRTFLFVILLVGLGCAWVGTQLQQKRRHEAAVNEVLKLGGQAHFSDDGVPAWKEWLFGSYAAKPFYLNLDYTNATDSFLFQTQGINLFSLSLRSTKATDAGLTYLKGLTSLQCISLNNTRVTQAGVDKLQQAIPGCEIIHSPRIKTFAPAPRP